MKDFIANIFELWGATYLGDFSKYMYKANLYGEVASWTVLIPLIVFFIYYKPLDHIRLAKKSIWLIILEVTSFMRYDAGSKCSANRLFESPTARNLTNLFKIFQNFSQSFL